MKKYLIILAICLLLSACGNMNEDSNGDKSEGILSTQESAVVNEDYSIITSFYDCFTELSKLIKEKQYEELNKKIVKSKDIIESFEEKAKENNSEYQTYFDNILNDAMFDLYKSTFCYGTEYILDTSVNAMPYIYLFETCVDSIIERELPFEYENQQQEAVNDETYVNAHKYVVEMVNSARKEGLDIVYNPSGGTTSYASYANFVNYNINGEIKYSLGFEFSSKENFIDLYFILDSMADNVFDTIDTLCFTDGKTIIEYNSTQMYNSGWGMTSVYHYNTTFGEEMNENYELLRVMIQNSDDISMIINNDIVLILTQEDVVNLRQYISLFDTIRMVYEGI